MKEYETQNKNTSKPAELPASEIGIRERIISIVVLVLMLVTVWYMLTLVLLTFIFVFVFLRLLGFIRKHAPFLRWVPDTIAVIILYAVFIFLLIIASIDFTPKLALQITEIANIFRHFNVDLIIDAVDPRYAEVLSQLDIAPYIKSLGEAMLSWLGWFGGFSLNFLLALLLSFLLLLEKERIKKFGEVLEKSRIAFMYSYFMNFGRNFVKTFAQVMNVQVTIAFINCILSIILLTILGFPQVMGLSIMIFILGLIPVAGVLISLIPLSLVAFNLGGLPKVVAVLIMIAFIHAIEAYVLSPKLMSNKTALPVSLVFIILVVAEHYLNVWGLLIGVPLFIFLLNIFEVDYMKAFKPSEPFLRKLRREKTVNRKKHRARRGARQ
ncbi:MAG: AI-2E family transporter [Clostridiales Family XIII bacterium]|jgi:predicted PurR-regulated permease PerM|nr:AI-2E family transporter [Clostridiales Family XIII bacterium]